MVGRLREENKQLAMQKQMETGKEIKDSQLISGRGGHESKSPQMHSRNGKCLRSDRRGRGRQKWGRGKPDIKTGDIGKISKIRKWKNKANNFQKIKDMLNLHKKNAHPIPGKTDLLCSISLHAPNY